MRWSCTRPGCEFAQTGVCARAAEFAQPEQECRSYLDGRPQGGPAPSPAAVFPPWTGDALGGELMALLALDTPLRKVLVAGRANSGKTCLLVAQLLELERRRETGLPGRFAGSYTLRGYERLTDEAFRFREGAEPIVPHTGRGGGRDPAWMHLAFRLSGGDVRHLLLSDLPGELFHRWATDRDAWPTAGVTDLWVVLDGADGGDAHRRRKARDLLARAGELHPRPVAVVLTKCDEAHPDSLRLLRDFAEEQLPGAPVYEVAAFPGRDPRAQARGVLAPLAPLLAPAPRPAEPPPRPSSTRFFDYFGVNL